MMLVSQPISGTPPNHHQTIGAVAINVRALIVEAARTRFHRPRFTLGALKIAVVATIERRNAGLSAIDGSGAERTIAAIAVTADAEDRLPIRTTPQARAAVMAARHALGEPPANVAWSRVNGIPIAAAIRKGSVRTTHPRISQ
jgi:hypothetical protein